MELINLEFSFNKCFRKQYTLEWMIPSVSSSRIDDDLERNYNIFMWKQITDLTWRKTKQKQGMENVIAKEWKIESTRQHDKEYLVLTQS